MSWSDAPTLLSRDWSRHSRRSAIWIAVEMETFRSIRHVILAATTFWKEKKSRVCLTESQNTESHGRNRGSMVTR